MPTERGTINGGMMQRPGEAPNVVIYVGAAGARVVTPNTPVPGMGAYGRIADPEGNVIGAAVKRGKGRTSKRRR